MGESDESQVVLTERRERVLIITLNRPDAMNAVNGAVAQGLERALDLLEQDDALGVGVLAARGKAFCAGADLKAIAGGRLDELHTVRGGFAGIARRARSKPLIAALHADALAGGCEIAMACDLIVAGADIRLGLPEVKWSLVALAGGVVRLPQLVGEKLALEMVLTGDLYPAQRLYEAGLISRLVPREAVVAEAIALAERIAANGPLAVQASRRIVTEGRDLDEAARWELCERVGRPVFASADAAEGPRAFIAKRRPVWQGK